MEIALKPKNLLQVLMMLLLLSSQGTTAQNIIVNTAPLEGLDITPDNMLGFHVQSLESENIICRIEGNISFRNSNHNIKYNFTYTIRPGLNVFDPALIHPQWSYSSSALRELFLNHKILPQGTYQYCVTIIPKVPGGDYTPGSKVDDCIYKQSKDLFSITLLEPENDAKIYEYNPMLTWVATYPFVNELTYKIRIAEIKDGQNTENAIARNNHIYSESNLMSNSIIYPVYARPLKVWQPYAWTVDAYYKGIPLGGAQPWKFTIIEDSLFKNLPVESSYVDVNIDEGRNTYYAVGQVKIRYSENDYLQNELNILLVRKGNELSKPIIWKVKRGVNFETYDVSTYRLRHNETFEIIVEPKNSRSTSNKKTIKYKYVNPDFVK